MTIAACAVRGSARSRRDYTIASSESCRRCHFDKYTKTLDSVHYAALARGEEPQEQCLWYDAESRRCRHYEWRPQICRDYELGGRACLERRRSLAVE